MYELWIMKFSYIPWTDENLDRKQSEYWRFDSLAEENAGKLRLGISDFTRQTLDMINQFSNQFCISLPVLSYKPSRNWVSVIVSANISISSHIHAENEPRHFIGLGVVWSSEHQWQSKKVIPRIARVKQSRKIYSDAHTLLELLDVFKFVIRYLKKNTVYCVFLFWITKRFMNLIWRDINDLWTPKIYK